MRSLYSTLAVRLGHSGLFRQESTGHPQLHIRAGIHIAPMHVEEGDVFGGTVNFAARVVGAIQGAEIWLSDRAKEDIDRLGGREAQASEVGTARGNGHERVPWEVHALGGGRRAALKSGSVPTKLQAAAVKSEV